MKKFTKIGKTLLKIIGAFLILLIINEFLIYYIVLAQCQWPDKINLDKLAANDDQTSVKAMILADIHMLGPFRGHWFDKLRREWQMHRAFQTTLTLFRPEVVFILGDLFDEGEWVTSEQFNDYNLRFQRLFHVSSATTKMFGALGNHDVGFHYKMSPFLIDRFENVYNNRGNELITINKINFVIINSMAMINDGCEYCEEAKKDLRKISKKLSKVGESQPILLQHFPTYRHSDSVCIDRDAEEIEEFREHWECLSERSTVWLGEILKPRVAFSGHSHDFCRLKNRLNIEEFTISSYNWRNKNNPKFLLATFLQDDYAVEVCEMPTETTVIAIYKYGMLFALVFIIYTDFFTTNTQPIKKNSVY